jgi:hypothetical protein
VIIFDDDDDGGVHDDGSGDRKGAAKRYDLRLL